MSSSDHIDELEKLLRQYCSDESNCSTIRTEELQSLLTAIPAQTKLHILQREYNPGWTALRQAASLDDTQVLSSLLVAVNQTDRLQILLNGGGKHNPLHTAAVYDHTEAVKTILNSLTYSQQLELMAAKDGDGETAMQCAELAGRTESVFREYFNKAHSHTS